MRRQNVPGYEGRFQPSTATVENPYDGQREERLSNTAENPTLAMFNMKRNGRRVIDEAQLRAAMEVHGLWRRLHGKSHGVIDPSNEPVDVSMSGRDWTPMQESAGRRLAGLRDHLGQRMYRLTILVAGQEMPPSMLTATMLGIDTPTRADHKYIARLYRDTLTSAAEFFGFVTAGSDS